MTAREIKAALVAVGVKHVEIARRARKSPQLVSDVIQGARENEEIARVIAEAIGKPVKEIFPVEKPATALAS